MVKMEAPEATPMEARVMTTMAEVASLAGDDSELESESEELVGENVGDEVNSTEEVKRCDEENDSEKVNEDVEEKV